jgi:hydrogenase nickel incorporation protein HypB
MNIRIYKPGEEPKESGNNHQNHLHNHHSHNTDHKHQHHSKEIEINTEILKSNNLLGERNRGYFEALNIFVLNLVSSPGSGKTSLLEKTFNDIGKNHCFYVIEGDQNTANDANRIKKTGVHVIQVNTGQGCHLDAKMVNQATKKLDPKKGSTLFIENVGNLVCPSLFDLGEKKRIVIFSVTEGDDKPEKYPTIFFTSDVCIINKTDLLPYVDFDMKKAKHQILHLNQKMVFFEISAKTGEGMEAWYNWLKLNA